MKKSVRTALLVALLAAAGPSLLAQAPRPPASDVVILLDSSQSMFPYFEDAVDWIVGPLAKEWLRYGDRLHVLSFSSSATLEWSDTLETEADARSALARLYLLAPLGRRTDLLRSLSETREYLAGIPAGGGRYAIMVTDGRHDPEPGSPYSGLDAAATLAALEREAAAIKAAGWTFLLVRVPFAGGTAGSGADSGTGSGADGRGGQDDGALPGGGAASVTGAAGAATAAPAPGAGTYFDDMADALGARVADFDAALAGSTALSPPRISWPAELGEVGRRFRLEVTIANDGDEARAYAIASFRLDGAEALAREARVEVPPRSEASVELSLILPDSVAPGPARFTAELVPADGERLSPARGPLSLSYVPRFLDAVSGSPVLLPGLLLLGAAILVALVLGFASREKARALSGARVADAVLDARSAAAAGRRRARADTAATTGAGADELSRFAARTRGDGAPSIAAGTGVAPGVAADELASYAARTRGDGIPPLESVRNTADAAADFAEYAARTRGDGIPELTPDAGAPASDNAGLFAEWAARARSETGSLPPRPAPAKAAAKPARRGPAAWETRIRKSESVRVEFQVRDQNAAIGMRNIRTLSPGSRRSIGGGSSDFLVFLLPVPRHVADASWDGESLTFVPRRPEFFPDLDGVLEDCMDREVRLVTRRGRELFIKFSRYVPPIERLNKLLHCIEMPGPEEPGLLD